MNTFAVLAKESHEEEQAKNRALTVARVRAVESFGGFLDNAKTRPERLTRLEATDVDLRKIVSAVTQEHGFGNPQLVYEATRSYLACSCDDGKCDDDCDCKECHGDDKGESKKPWEKDSSVHGESQSKHTNHVFKPINRAADGIWEHISAEPAWEDSYRHERQELPKSDGTGLGDQGAVKTDRGKSGDVAGSSLDRIDVDSVRNRLEQQTASDHADYLAKDFNPDSPVRETVNAGTPMQPEYTKADSTDTWHGTAGQASPVTNQSLNVISKYRVLPDLS